MRRWVLPFSPARRRHSLRRKRRLEMDQPGRTTPDHSIHLEPLLVQRMHIMALDLDDLLEQSGRRGSHRPSPLHDAGGEARGPGGG